MIFEENGFNSEQKFTIISQLLELLLFFVSENFILDNLSPSDIYLTEFSKIKYKLTNRILE